MRFIKQLLFTWLQFCLSTSIVKRLTITYVRDSLHSFLWGTWPPTQDTYNIPSLSSIRTHTAKLLPTCCSSLYPRHCQIHHLIWFSWLLRQTHQILCSLFIQIMKKWLGDIKQLSQNHIIRPWQIKSRGQVSDPEAHSLPTMWHGI